MYLKLECNVNILNSTLTAFVCCNELITFQAFGICIPCSLCKRENVRKIWGSAQQMWIELRYNRNATTRHLLLLFHKLASVQQ